MPGCDDGLERERIDGPSKSRARCAAVQLPFIELVPPRARRWNTICVFFVFLFFLLVRSGSVSFLFSSYDTGTRGHLVPVFVTPVQLACTLQVRNKVEVWEWIVKRCIFDPFSESSG